MTEPAIHVEHVWKKFRRGEVHDSLREFLPALARAMFNRKAAQGLRGKEFWALQDVSFEVPRGASMGIIGPNGAGKSTMLKLLSRIIRPNQGSYRVNGRLCALIEVAAGFHGDLTGRENIYLNGAIMGMKRAEIRRKEESIIEFAGIPDFIDTPVKRYSSGMGARLGFAVAAHLDPEVLLIDEVLSVGDAKFRRKCINHMHNLIKSDVTVVFISHILDQVRALCPNTLVLDRGNVIYHGATEGAIMAYMKALSDVNDTNVHEVVDAELRAIRFCDAQGREVIEWPARKPVSVEFELVVHHPLQNPSIQLNFHDISGFYLGTANSGLQGVKIPDKPGVYPIRFILDPNPLADGNFSIRFQIFNNSNQLVWVIRQMLTISVRGSGLVTELITCDGRWEMLEPEPPLAQSLQSPPRARGPNPAPVAPRP